MHNLKNEAPYDRSRPILFFSPEAGVEPHYKAQVLLARTLKERGYNTIFARCFGVLPRCPVYDMHLLPDYSLELTSNPAVCGSCVNCSQAHLSEAGIEAVDMRHFMDNELLEHVSEVIRKAPQDLTELHYDEISFGKLASIDFVLATKQAPKAALDERHRLIWLSYIKSALLSYIVTRRICKHLNIGRVTYFNDYAIMLACRKAAEREGVPAYYVSMASHCVVDKRRLVVVPEPIRFVQDRQLSEWRSWQDLSLSPPQIRVVGEDILTRVGRGGSHVYSPPKTFTASSDASSLNGKKLLVAFTSSIDEYVAARMTIEGLGKEAQFISTFGEEESVQISWLRALTEWVEKRSDYFLIVRVHPREGKNKREGLVSDHYLRLRELFDHPFSNVHFVWPEDAVSSYDLVEIADLVLSSYSTLALEAARLGVPVLACHKGVTVAGESFVEWAATPAEYFSKLEAMAQPAEVGERMLHAFRFYHMSRLSQAVDLSDIIPSYNYDGPLSKRSPAEAATLEHIVIGADHPVNINMARLQSQQGGKAGVVELLAFKREVRRLLHFFLTGEDLDHGDFTLALVSGAGSIDIANATAEEMEIAPTSPHFIHVKGGEVAYHFAGRRVSKYSPMLARLAAVGAQLRINCNE
ncbi:MAG: hypothetical protein J5J00_11040 [Deltaproteobacteria bacterium]|nr:hypothetical protein [Deltaproteobacteria bacterium]